MPWQGSFEAKYFFLINLFTHKYSYTKPIYSHTHRDFYSKTLLSTGAFTHTFYRTQTFLHTDIFTHRNFYTKIFLYTGAFIHRCFYPRVLRKLCRTRKNRVFSSMLNNQVSFRTKKEYTEYLKIVVLPKFLIIESHFTQINIVYFFL